MNVNGIEITHETILATRKHFADIDSACIAEALSGEVKVNDLDKYIKWMEQSTIDTMSGKYDHTLAFIQCALWKQTGECIALLP